MTNVLPLRPRTRAHATRAAQLPAHKIEAYQIALRQYAQHLTAFEIIVLMQIVDRTAGWGVLEASFTTDALREGDDLYGGISNAVSRRSMFRALDALEAKGIITRRVDRRNKDKRHYRVDFDWRPNMPVPLPKRLKNKTASECQSDTTECHSGTTECHSGTLLTDNHKQIVFTDNHTGIPASRDAVIKPENEIGRKQREPITAPAERARIIAAQATANNRTAAAAHTAADRLKNSAASVERVWHAAVTETFPGHPCPAWGAREKGQTTTAMKKWRQPGVPFHDFIEWCARNWTAIMRQQFGWMTKQAPPAVPALPFLFSFFDGFIECYAERKLEAWMDGKDRTSLERLMGRGLTYEQAMASIAEDKAALALREEMSKREEAVKLEGKVAKIRLQKAAKLETLGGAPMHPKSPAARKLIDEVRRSAIRATPVPSLTTTTGVDCDFPPVEVFFVDPDRNPFD